MVSVPLPVYHSITVSQVLRLMVSYYNVTILYRAFGDLIRCECAGAFCIVRFDVTRIAMGETVKYPIVHI